jgi:gliding motility-associated-like protein
VCSGSSVTLQASGATSYTWLPGNNNANSISVSPLATFIYTLVGGAGTCTSLAVQEVTVSNGIALTVYQGSMLLCAGTKTTLIAGGAQNYLWEPGGLSGSTVTVNPLQNTTYTVTGSIGSCIATKVVTVKVSSVLADFVFSGGENDNFITVDFQNISVNNNFNHWYFSNGYDTYAVNPGVYFGDPGTYVACLYVKNNNGCSDTLCKVVKVGCAENTLFVPNTFTPNGDGLNDLFNVVTLPQCIQKFNLAIYNVWGQKVFSTDKLEEGWNGMYKGQEAEDDVYSYILEYTMDSGKAYRKTGHVTLIK